MPKLEGFGFFEKRTVRHAISEGERALDKALAEAFKDNDKFLKRVDAYFGAGQGGMDATTHLVMKTLSSMKVTYDMDIYRVLKGGDNPGTNADAENIPQRDIGFKGSAQKKARTARWQGTTLYQGRPVNAIEAAANVAGSYRLLEVRLYDLFFQMPSKKHHEQSQIETFLHELSHVAAGTHDVDAPRCYGYSGVLHARRVGKGAMNAESYGMFLQSYLT